MANFPIHIEYNDKLGSLEALLGGVERAGDFYASGRMDIPMPKLEVDGVGVLSFPVPPAQLDALIRHATRAPYGRGPETRLDESVRKVWQLTPEQVRVGGKSWTVGFKEILDRAIAGLGCAGMAFTAEFYKLLIYDPGGFFAAHRDTEKTAGMFGTLVIVLPAAHRGGELVLRHAGRECVVDLSSTEVSEAGFAAFYADCEHEVRPITEGHRVCLVYNLAHKSGVRDVLLHAPDYRKETTAVATLLKNKLGESVSPVKIAWLLEHNYSPEGLSFAGLKGADAARVKVLSQAAEAADCVAHLGIVHIEESGPAEPAYDEYYADSWRDYDAEEDEEDVGKEDFEVIEVSDWRHTVSQWRAPGGQPVDFGEIPLAAGELLPVGALDHEKPDAQRLMEASGNEGASFERSYHRAALVIWRQADLGDVLLQAGVAAALPCLREWIERSAANDAPAGALKEAVGLARRMVRQWRDAAGHDGYSSTVPPTQRVEMLRLLTRLGDAAMLDGFVAAVVVRDYDGSENAALVAGGALLGAKRTGHLLTELVGRQMRIRPRSCAELLLALAFPVGVARDRQWQRTVREIADVAVAKLDEIGLKPREEPWWRARAKPQAVDAGFVVAMLDALEATGAAEWRVAIVDKFAARPAVFDPVTVLVPALVTITKWDVAVERLWDHAVDFLLHRSESPPEEPQDWRQEVNLSCDCADCRELQRFALNPVEREHRFRIRKDRRQHLHRQIDTFGLDMTHVTERQGSPQTLVCGKTRRSYQLRCKQYRQDLAAIATLAELAGKTGLASADCLKRIENALSRQ